MAFVVPSIFTAVDRVTGPLNVMGRGAVRFSRTAVNAVDRVDRALIGVGHRINSVTGNFGVLLGTAVAFDQAREAINTIADFETGLVAVGKTADIADAELTMFGHRITQLSRDLKVVSSEKLLEMGAAAGQLGVKGVDNLLKVSETMTKLETATDIVGEEGAKSIARILEVTGDGIGVVDKFGAAIVALGNNSAASESEILSMSNEVARATAPFKLGSTAVLGISAALKSVGVQSEAGGSAIGKLFKQMDTAVETGNNLAAFSKILGITEAQMKKQFKEDAKSLFLPFIQGLSKIDKEGGSVNLALKSVGIGGEIAFKGLAPLAGSVDLVQKSLELANKEFIAGEALNKEFATASNTLRSALNSVSIEFKNIINDTATTNDSMISLKNTIFVLRDNLSSIISVGFKLVAFFVAAKIAVIALSFATKSHSVFLGIQSAWLGRSSLALATNTLALKTQAIALGVASKAQAALNFLMTANPIGIIVAAIALLVGWIYILIRNWDEWGAAISLTLGPVGILISFIRTLKNEWDKVVMAFDKGGIKGAFKAIGAVFLEAILMPMEQLIKLINKIPGINIGTGFIEGLRKANFAVLDRAAGLDPLDRAGVRPTEEGGGGADAPAAPEPISIAGLNGQLFNDQMQQTVDTKGKVEISVKDEQGLLNVDASQITDNIDVNVQQGFTFASQ